MTKLTQRKIALDIVNRYFDTLMRIDVSELDHASNLLDELNEIDSRVESDILFELTGEDNFESNFAFIVNTICDILLPLQRA